MFVLGDFSDRPVMGMYAVIRQHLQNHSVYPQSHPTEREFGFSDQVYALHTATHTGL